MARPKTKPLPGRQLAVMAAGVGILVHAGYVILELRKNAAHTVESIPLLVVAWIFLGALLSLFGSIGRFEPIRVSDAPKPTWDAQHIRNDFIMYQSRAPALCAFIEEKTALPPNVAHASATGGDAGEEATSAMDVELTETSKTK
ncbi:unnamed protein product [Amoebophrya sp. A120]|nr:unnamed protein product [Amoebophrya sp. A120]|eukprot:GSA120T00021592001.1